jgi:hypothetical protein
VTLLLLNAASYLAGWDFAHPALVVIGLMLAGAGAGMVRRARAGSQ